MCSRRGPTSPRTLRPRHRRVALTRPFESLIDCPLCSRRGPTSPRTLRPRHRRACVAGAATGAAEGLTPNPCPFCSRRGPTSPRTLRPRHRRARGAGAAAGAAEGAPWPSRRRRRRRRSISTRAAGVSLSIYTSKSKYICWQTPPPLSSELFYQDRRCLSIYTFMSIHICNRSTIDLLQAEGAPRLGRRRRRCCRSFSTRTAGVYLYTHLYVYIHVIDL